MTTKLETLEAALRNALGDDLQSLTVALGEITVVVKAANYLSAMRMMRDHADLRFEELIDLCGIDYSTYGDGAYLEPARSLADERALVVVVQPDRLEMVGDHQL